MKKLLIIMSVLTIASVASANIRVACVKDAIKNKFEGGIGLMLSPAAQLCSEVKTEAEIDKRVECVREATKPQFEGGPGLGSTDAVNLCKSY